MLICIFEDDQVPHLNPLALTRAAYDLRIGARTLAERISDTFQPGQVILHARKSVASVTGAEHDALVNRIPGSVDVLFVNGRWFVQSGPLLDEIRGSTKARQPVLFAHRESCLAAWIPGARSEIVEADALTPSSFPEARIVDVAEAKLVSRLWHPLDLVEEAIREDFSHRTRGYNVFERPGAVIQDGAILANAEQIYIGQGATIRPGAILNAEDGPIYVDDGVTIMEQAVVRGPAYIGPHSQVKIGGILEAVSIGPWCKAGGEIHHSIFHSYSNKAHAGFLGHSYLGRWCNLGADTNNSNLKNDYGNVSLHNPVTREFENTGRQFVGLFMGDHSKTGITSMFNTGTVMGVFCNVYGSGFHDRVIPSFSWGTPNDYQEYRLEKALRVAEAVMARRSVTLSEAEREVLARIHADAHAASQSRPV